METFLNLYKKDLTPYISKMPIMKKEGNEWVKKGELDYISWTDCLRLLYEFGAKSVKYGNILSENGHSLFLKDGKCPEVHVFVEIDGDRYELIYPVIDGARDIDVAKIAQSDVHNATQRGFVKCVAMNTGLGLSLWEKEDKELSKKPKDDIEYHNLYAVIERVKRKYAAAVEQTGGQRELSGIIETSEKAIEATFKHASNLGGLEKRLDGVLRHD